MVTDRLPAARNRWCALGSLRSGGPDMCSRDCRLNKTDLCAPVLAGRQAEASRGLRQTIVANGGLEEMQAGRDE